MSDGQTDIAKKVADQLYWDNRINASDLKVDAHNGTVILTGTAPSYRVRRIAEEDALAVSGVDSVDNQIALADGVPTDQEIQASLERLFGDNSDFDMSKLQISVDKGAVTLEGTVDAYWKKLIADDMVSLVPDVFTHYNKLTVVPTETFKDEAIAKAIMEAIERNKWIHPHKVTVKVDQGVVTLAGKVVNWAAYKGAVDAANCTAGVIDVDNQLTYE